jgi:hypothetical protein
MYSKVHQKTPVFLLKYCHNKDLKEIELRISVKKFEIRSAKAKIHPPAAGKNSNGRNFNDQNKSPIAHFAPNPVRDGLYHVGT